MYWRYWRGAQLLNESFSHLGRSIGGDVSGSELASVNRLSRVLISSPTSVLRAVATARCPHRFRVWASSAVLTPTSRAKGPTPEGSPMEKGPRLERPTVARKPSARGLFQGWNTRRPGPCKEHPKAALACSRRHELRCVAARWCTTSTTSTSSRAAEQPEHLGTSTGHRPRSNGALGTGRCPPGATGDVPFT